MKTICLALTMLLVLCTGCASLPKPVNANGSVNPSVVVAEAEITYRNAAHSATAYVTSCHLAAPTPSWCSQQLISQLKVASDRAWAALQNAETAVKTLAPGSTGIDKAINEMQAALIFLQGFVSQAKKPVGASVLPSLNILEGVLA